MQLCCRTTAARKNIMSADDNGVDSKFTNIAIGSGSFKPA